jgi:hypothetical protein
MEVSSWLSSVYRGWCNYHAIPGQLRPPAPIPHSDPADVASHAAATHATGPASHLGQVLTACPPLAPHTQNPASLSRGAVRSSLSKVKAVCDSIARTDLCEGRPATVGSIAIVNSDPDLILVPFNSAARDINTIHARGVFHNPPLPNAVTENATRTSPFLLAIIYLRPP